MKNLENKRIAQENDILFQLLKNKMEMELELQRTRYLAQNLTRVPFTCAVKK